MAAVTIHSDLEAQENKVCHCFHCSPIYLPWCDGIRKGWQKVMTGDDTVGWPHQLDGYEFEQALGVGDEQGSLVCCSPWGHKESDTTEWLNWTELTGPDTMILVFWILSFKPAFSLSSFTFIKRLLSPSSIYAIRIVSSAYLRLLIFLLAISSGASIWETACTEQWYVKEEGEKSRGAWRPDTRLVVKMLTTNLASLQLNTNHIIY